jgi:ligand-binding sensor domain-containing protein
MVNLTARVVLNRNPRSALAALMLIVATAINCAAHPHAAFSAPVPIWSIFTRENSDLPSDTVRALALDPSGSLWVGTSDGLARLDKDGHWQTYTTASTEGGLPNDEVQALALGPDGSLWAGTSGGLARLDKDGHWQTYTTASTNGGLPDDRVEALALGPDGSLWAGTYTGGVARLDKDGHWQTYTAASTDGGLPDGRVEALALGPDGSLWAGTDPGLRLPGTFKGGIGRLDKDGHWQTYSKDSTNGGLPRDRISVLSFDPDGSLWVGTHGSFAGGLARLDKDGHWQTYTTASTNGGLPDDRVEAVALGPDGSLWVGTSAGLAWLDKNGHWQTYTTASTKGGLPDDSVSALARDLDNSIWIGTFGGGLARLNKDGHWETFSKDSTNGGLPSDEIQALAPGPRGSLWIGTHGVGTRGGGLARIDRAGNWRTYTKASTNGGLPEDSVWALALDLDNSLWVGTWGSGLARLDEDGRWQTYTMASTNGGLPDDGIRALASGADGSVWVGTKDGLARLDKDGHWQTYTNASTKGGLPDDMVRALALDPDGSLWVGTGGVTVGTSGGLARLNKDGHWRTYTMASTKGCLPNDTVQALALGPDGSLWVGTEGGLARLDKGGDWRTYTKASTKGGLPNDRIEALALGPDGSLWAGTFGGGLSRRGKDGAWETFNKGNTNGGLLSDYVRALALVPDGSLWAGAGSSLWAGAGSFDFEGGMSKFNHPLGRTVRIVEVIGKVGEVSQAEQTVAVVAIDDSYLTPPGMFHYLWSMAEKGLLHDRPGRETKTRSSFYKTSFDHDGAYRLRVIALDRYGNRSEPKDINFKVALPKQNSFWDSLASAWRAILAVLSGFYALTLAALILLTRRSATAFRILSDAVWAKWLTWPFFFLRHVSAVQRWVLEPWFQAIRRGTLTDVPFLDPPVVAATGSRSEGTALLQLLRGSPRLWLHGRSGMGKSSIFEAWGRDYFAASDLPNLNAAVHRYGFILIMLPLRSYASLPVPDANRPESWVLEVLRRHLEQFGFVTRDLGLIDAILRAGHVALAIDGTNEADRDLSLAAFARQFTQTRLLVTSQAIADRGWEIWELPENIGELRDRLLALWLGDRKGGALSRRIVAGNLSGAIVSGYDLRLLADLTTLDPEHATLPADRIALYRAMLSRASDPDGQPLRLEGLKQLAWLMAVQRRRRILPDDEKVLGIGTLKVLQREGLRIVRPIGAEAEFRHDQMRAFLAALWLVEETPTLQALQKAATDAGAFGLNRRDQEELWGFVALLLTLDTDLEALWKFANNDPVERGILLATLQSEADKRNITLVRVAQRNQPETVGTSPVAA